ncbi:hypothetical protein M3M39_04950 [Fructilactobacillus hinvesii]|uniref:DUF1056 family protein n=1 Tax=Fructilactobacillus hinvesii TaxID=2940300 RepID=A0ABY5BQV0_9LACO|nr:hypothetical protein [Fructilactobacillus hinvesii]USS87472.1 hypothetical protein M3M39_04950 [Fructilactobacillus hinvesii]
MKKILRLLIENIDVALLLVGSAFFILSGFYFGTLVGFLTTGFICVVWGVVINVCANFKRPTKKE